MISSNRTQTSNPSFEEDDGLVQNGSISTTNAESSHTCIDDVDEYEKSVVSVLTKRRRLARFSRVVEVYLIESHDCYTDEEYVNCWYTPEEKDMMKYNRGQYLSRMNAGKAQEKHNRTYRGLETCCETGFAEFQDQIYKTVDAVMDEQDRQWAENVTDELKIRAASLQATEGSAERARHLARLDEFEAMSIHNDGCKVLRHDPPGTKARFVRNLMKASNNARRKTFIATVA